MMKMDLGGNTGMGKNSKLEKIKEPKIIATIAIVIILGVTSIYLATSALSAPGPLETYIKETQPVGKEDNVTLIVEYRNTLEEDVREVNIEVEPIAKDKIEVVGENEVTEENIGKGQLRRFEFPIRLKDVTSGSTYAIETKAKANGNEFTSRTSIEIEEN